MNKYNNPTWWNKDNDTAWDRVKAAFQRDWDQTKHDVGGKAPETKQNAADTVKQAAGKQPIPPRGAQVYEKAEPAYRFGYGARSHYGKKYSNWNTELEQELKRDWKSTYPDRTWDADQEYVRSGWSHKG